MHNMLTSIQVSVVCAPEHTHDQHTHREHHTVGALGDLTLPSLLDTTLYMVQFRKEVPITHQATQYPHSLSSLLTTTNKKKPCLISLSITITSSSD